MSLPVGVITTTVKGGPYLDAALKPVKGMAVFTPDPVAVSEGIVIAPTEITKNLKDGTFTVDLPTSVDGGSNPDVTYTYGLYLDDGVYSRRVIQVPVSDDEIFIEDLVGLTPSPQTGRFVLPARDVRPTNPRPGELYYNTETGDAEYWNAEEDMWVGLTLSSGSAPTGPAGGVLTGTYPNPGLAALSVDTGHLKALSVTADKLSVVYVSMNTYLNDLNTTALALGDLQDQIDNTVKYTDTALVRVLELGDPVPPDTPVGTVILRKTT